MYVRETGNCASYSTCRTYIHKQYLSQLFTFFVILIYLFNIYVLICFSSYSFIYLHIYQFNDIFINNLFSNAHNFAQFVSFTLMLFIFLYEFENVFQLKQTTYKVCSNAPSVCCFNASFVGGNNSNDRPFCVNKSRQHLIISRQALARTYNRFTNLSITLKSSSDKVPDEPYLINKN